MRAQEFAVELDRLGPDTDRHYERNERRREDGDGRREARPDRLPLFPPLPPAESYPLDALGPILGEAARAIARKVQAPAAIAAQSVLAAASLAVQAHADVRMPYGQRRPLSLYLVSSASSGDRKSTTDNEALWPVTRREDALQEMYGRDHQEWLVTYAAWSAEKKKIEGDRKLGFEDRRFALTTLGPEPQPPIRPVLTSAEPTFEGLIKSWPSMPAAQGVFSAEGGQFTGGHGMAQENRLRTAAGFSVLWDGKPVTRVRALDGVSVLKGRRLAMHLMVQPEAAAAFMSDPVLRDQGLLSRILVAAPDSIAGTRLFRVATAADAEQIRRYHARMLSLLEGWPSVIDHAQGLQPRELPMSEAAEARWRDFYNWIEERSGPQGDLRLVRDFASKAAEHAARIAGVLAIVADEHALEISAEIMTAAARLATWYTDEATRLQQACRTDPALLRAQALLDWLRARDEQDVKFSDILRLGPAPTRTKKEADAAVRTLMEHNLVEEVRERPRLIRVAGASTRS
ncbi:MULTISPECIES: YfjI family protein [unclassified Methylobacterium]|uniref:YfjI family protein n=1 Tax=unclassified Methylobacterium TaxID=2615210 RepID=UPI0016500700|nr:MULTISPECIES: YfjI family protein [unclassified Methylobacterium]